MGSNIQRNKTREGLKCHGKRSWVLRITLVLKSNKSSSGAPEGLRKQKTKQKINEYGSVL